MDVYLVGGAVRDALLGRQVTERDWVVVGSTADELRHLGYRQVGRDFPVFLHPDTREEYALARRERKTGPGHTGFDVQTGPGVSLEEDLLRRDLTINAIAQDLSGQLIDPCDGQRDLSDRCLRHVSDAFREDPLRVFRVARFAAELPDFSVHPETNAFMAGMAGELSELPQERVWQEFHKALAGAAPERFVEVLHAAGCLAPWFVELDGVRIDHRLPTPLARYGGIGWTTAEVVKLSERLRVPNEYARLAGQVVDHARLLLDWRGAEAGAVLACIKSINGWRNPLWRRELFAVVGDVGGVTLDALDALLDRVESEIDVAAFVAQGYEDAALGERLDEERLRLFENFRGLGNSG